VRQPLIAIVGPTGCGKSDLALQVAAEIHGEVVNCDSLQVYRYFDIGTAKLSAGLRRGIPHHLIDILDPNEMFTAGEYSRRARLVLAEIVDRGRVPVLAGGTGFYLRALIDGLFRGPGRDQELRDRLSAREQKKAGSVHRLLRRLDPGAARRIHPNDIPKTTRALEVCLATRRPMTELFLKGRSSLEGFRTLKIGLSPEREVLYGRLDRRTREMFEAGLVDEVRSILARGFASTEKPFESHGYHQALQVLNVELTLEEAIFYAQRNTRQYAKRQMTWFRQEPGVEWFSGFGDDEAIRKRVMERVREFLKNSPPISPASHN
jgi:tRNA dimethylallyltransferase